ncbi:MAG TPA: hypothetical protein VL175_08305 [Pirellulales bacterium]|jgi:hypothetical protein|nr:hypothetical protein [Pirellulales bacterium]
MADSPLRKNDDAEPLDNRENAADEPDKQAQPAAERTDSSPPPAESAADAKDEQPAEPQGDLPALVAPDLATADESGAATPEEPNAAAEATGPPLAGTPPSVPDPMELLAGESPAQSFQWPTDLETSSAAIEDVGLDSGSITDGSDETTNAAANDGPIDEPLDDELSAAGLEIEASENPDATSQAGHLGNDVKSSADQSLSPDMHLSAPIDPTLIYNLDGPPPKIEWGPYDPSKETSHLEQLPYRFSKDDAGSEPSSGFDVEPGRTPPWPDTAFESPEPLVQAAPVFVSVSLADSQIEQLIESALGKSMARDVAALGELAESVVEHAFWLRTCHERALNG